jgi:deoxycytidylate deaminase
MQNIIAIITKKGKIVAVGKNSYSKTHPTQKKWADKVGHHDRIYLHAEIDALIKAKGKGDTISIFRFVKNGYGLAKPCPVCSLALAQTNLKIQHT